MKYLKKFEARLSSEEIIKDLEYLCKSYLTELYDKYFDIRIGDDRKSGDRSNIRAAHKVIITTPRNEKVKWLDIKYDVIQFLSIINDEYIPYKITGTQRRKLLNSCSVNEFSSNGGFKEKKDYIFFRTDKGRLFFNIDDIVNDKIDDSLILSRIFIFINKKK